MKYLFILFSVFLFSFCYQAEMHPIKYQELIQISKLKQEKDQLKSQIIKYGYKPLDTIKTYNADGNAYDYFKDSLNNVVIIIADSPQTFPIEIIYRTPYEKNYKSLLKEFNKNDFTFQGQDRIIPKRKNIRFIKYYSETVENNTFYYVEMHFPW